MRKFFEFLAFMLFVGLVGICQGEETEQNGDWEIRYYVDEFKFPTDKGYVSNIDPIVGIFSNSATNNSLLKASILVDVEDFAIMLFEYGSRLVNNSSSRNSEGYEIKVRIEDGTIYTFNGSIPRSGDRIIVSNAYRLIEILNANQTGDIAFYIVQSDRPITNYLFIVQSSNFANAYKTLRDSYIRE